MRIVNGYKIKFMLYGHIRKKQAEAEVVPSSSLVEVGVEVEGGV